VLDIRVAEPASAAGAEVIGELGVQDHEPVLDFVAGQPHHARMVVVGGGCAG
jgi:hypothetical protein